MKFWTTIIKAINPVTGELCKYGGPNIQAPTKLLAHEFCQNNELGYCEIGDELVAEIPCVPGTCHPDWEKKIDYQNIQNN